MVGTGCGRSRAAERYVAEFIADFGLIIRRYWAGVYLQGLFLDGERKSIQPLAQRVSVPGWRAIRCRHCSNSSTRARGTSRRCCGPTGGCWRSAGRSGWSVVIDDTGFAKKGRHSVGVARQYSGTLGKTDNCQVAVSLHYAAPKGDYPLALRLFLPESWTSQPERMGIARVPLAEQTPMNKE